MPADAKAKKKILFVDDSAEFLDIFTQAMVAQSQGEWEVYTAANAGKALAENVDRIIGDNLNGMTELKALIKAANREWTPEKAAS